MSVWSLSEWVHYQENLHSHRVELGLHRVRIVWQRILAGGQRIECPVIVVGGTNGKGSTVAFLESMYLQAGYHPIAYTSPHIDRYNERIRIAGENITDQQLVDAFEVIQLARNDISLSYFEFGTLAAFYIAARNSPDVLILEVGLGGRLDAVNILQHDVAIITNIAMDHMEWLGDSREKIAVEKAGIARSARPLILADTDMPVSLYAQAARIGAHGICLGQDIFIDKASGGWQYHYFDQTYTDLPFPGIPGEHQLKNAAAAICAVNCLESRLPVSESSICAALLNTRLSGRFEKVCSQPDIYLDVAHNPAAAQVLSQMIEKLNTSGRWIAILALQCNREPEPFLAPLLNIIDVWYVTGISGDLGHPTAKLAKAVREGRFDVPVRQMPHIREAIQDAAMIADNRDHVIVLGSFYAVSEARSALYV